jgi:aminoglycoside 3-N-acetyltransferase
MSEEHIIRHTVDGPVTVPALKRDLARLGVRAGMGVLVHSSLSALGWVCGGAPAVILALEDLLGPGGTLVMPTHSALSDPADWCDPPVPEVWWDSIRCTMPAFDMDLTPTQGMGAIPESFRKQRGVARSNHPQVSFAAWGKDAIAITGGHSLEFGLGDGSPLARLYEIDGWVLLLGVTHRSNSSLHLAEYRADYPTKRLTQCGAPVLVNGERHWVEFLDLALDISDFETIGKQFEAATGLVRRGKVAGASSLLMPQRALVDYAVGWIERHRGVSHPPTAGGSAQ